MKQLHKQGRVVSLKNTLRKTRVEKTAAELRKKLKHLNRSYLKNHSPEPDSTYSHVLDEYFRMSFSTSKAGLGLDPISNPYAIIATGSYGRNEVCRQSDVSILFIFRNDVPEDSADLIREILYPLWDSGFIISHTTRTLKECISSAMDDYCYLSSLVDSRFICGAWLLYSKLMNNLREKVVFNKKKMIVSQLFKRDKKRHGSYDSRAYQREPDLVYSPGGLKDYHSILSTARIKSGLIEPRDLVYSMYLSEKEYDTLEISIRFIRKTASLLNIITGRSQNRLMIKHRAQLALFMKYKNRNGHKAEEIFFNELHAHMEHIRQVHSLFYLSVLPEAYTKKYGYSLKKNVPVKWLEISRGFISFKSPLKLIKHPRLILDIFRESDRHNAPLSPEAIRLIREFGFLMNQDFPGRTDIRDLFEELLFSDTPRLRTPLTLLETGVLTVFIPEFLADVSMDHPDIRPVHPECRLSLNILDELKNEIRVTPGTPRGIVFEKDVSVLFWAGVLYGGHGGGGSGHVVTILKRFEKSKGFIEKVLFLIENLRLFDRIMTRGTHGSAGGASASEVYSINELNLIYLLRVAVFKTYGVEEGDFFTEKTSGLFHKIIKAIRFNQSVKARSTQPGISLNELTRMMNENNPTDISVVIDENR